MRSKVIKFTLLLAGLMIQVVPSKNPVVTGKWLERQLRLKQDRLPAAAEAAPLACFSDQFTVAGLKREAAHYEAQLAGTEKLSGRWKHLDLRDLPLPQARFLKAIESGYGDVRTPNAIDFSECKDVPCIINAVYGPGADVEGWVIYLWWLKTESILNFKNQFYQLKPGDIASLLTQPGSYNGNPHPLSDYLFDRNELYGFWRLSHMLPTTFKTLTNLKEIARVPRGESISYHQATTCGIANGAGYIILNDGCLKLGDMDFEKEFLRDRGSLYLLVTHEMGHLLDNKMSGNPARYEYYSHQEEWQALGQWSKTETTEGGVVTVSWKTLLPDTAFVREYAKNSPVEHFADTTAYYRYDGELTKSKIPAGIYSKLQNAIFETDEFTDLGFPAYLHKLNERELSQQVLQATMECYRQEAPLVGAALAENELPVALEIDKRRCFHSKREVLITRAIADIRLNTVDGCNYLRKPERVTNFSGRLRTWVSQQYQVHLKQVLADEKYFEVLQEFYQTLEKGVVPVQLITDCYGSSNEAACYQDKVTNFIAETVSESQVNAVRLRKDLFNRFVRAYPFETLRTDMIKTFQDFLSTQVVAIQESAQDLWKRCEAEAPSNVTSPRPGQFSVGTGWMISSQYNCLNGGLADTMNSTISAMSFEGEGIDSDQERRILRDLVISNFLDELRRLYKEAKDSELKELHEARGTTEALGTFLAGDLSWLKSFDTNFRGQCLTRALKVLPQEVRYHSGKDREAIVELSCSAVAKSTALKKYKEEHPEFSMEFHVRTYLTEMERWLTERAKFCEEKYPMGGIIARVRNRGRRSDCFKQGWPEANRQMINRSQREYNITLSAEAMSRIETDGSKIYKRIRSDLIGELLPDIGL